MRLILSRSPAAMKYARRLAKRSITMAGEGTTTPGRSIAQIATERTTAPGIKVGINTSIAPIAGMIGALPGCLKNMSNAADIGGVIMAFKLKDAWCCLDCDAVFLKQHEWGMDHCPDCGNKHAFNLAVVLNRMTMIERKVVEYDRENTASDNNNRKNITPDCDTLVNAVLGLP
jgi:hypothetical protein